MFDHILVPLDGSSLAECVLPHAMALANAFEARVTLLRVLKCPASIGQLHPPDPLDWRLYRTEVEAYLDEQVERLRDAYLEAECALREGQPAQCIIEFARSQNVDLIALSSHGESGLSSWNVSSVVQKVILRSHLSTLIVRAYQPPYGDPTRSHYRRLLVPLDGSHRAECTLQPADRLAHFLNSQLLLAHVVRRPELPRHVPPTPEDQKLADRLTERNQQEASLYLSRLPAPWTGDVQSRLLVSEDVAWSLHELVEKEGVDLVVMSAHGYSGKTRWPYGSMATNFIVYGTTPLLIVQDLTPHEIDTTVAEMVARERQGH